MPEYEAKRYEGRVRKGGILLSVHCDNAEWSKTARSILKRTGAGDISTTGEAKADFARTEKPMPRAREIHVQVSALLKLHPSKAPGCNTRRLFCVYRVSGVHEGGSLAGNDSSDEEVTASRSQTLPELPL